MPSLLGSSLKVPKRNDLAVPIQHVEDTDVVVFLLLYFSFCIPLHSPAPPLYNCDEMYILCGFKVSRDSMCIHVRTRTDSSPIHICSQISAVNNLHYQP